jgi:hypothetical protein
VKRLAATAAARLAERRAVPEGLLEVDPQGLALAFERGGLAGALRWRAGAARSSAVRPSREQIDAALAKLRAILEPEGGGTMEPRLASGPTEAVPR